MYLKRIFLISGILFFIVRGISGAELTGEELTPIEIPDSWLNAISDMPSWETPLSWWITDSPLWQELTWVDSIGEAETSVWGIGDISGGIGGGFGLSQDILSSDFLVTSNSSPITELIISEVFFDGSDEWLEISNIWSEDFSWNLTLTGIGIHATIYSNIASKQSIVIAKSGKTYDYFTDQSVIQNYVSMGFTDTKQIDFSLLYSWDTIDSFTVDTWIVAGLNDKLTSLEKIKQNENYLITGAIVSRTSNVKTGYIANPGKLFEVQEILPQTWLLPHIKITEVYVDDDTRFELSNIWPASFVWNLLISGAKSSSFTLPNVSLPSYETKVYGNTCGQLLDASVVGESGLHLSISKTKQLNLKVFFEWILLDDFIVDTGYIKKYVGYQQSFEKVGTEDFRITTRTTLDRRFNNAIGYVSNPGKVYSTGENIIDMSIPEKLDPVYTGDFPIDCTQYSDTYEAQINEVFFGNEVYHPFVEVKLSEDLGYEYLTLSWSALATPMDIVLDDPLFPVEKNTIFLISDDEKWYDDGVDSFSNSSLKFQMTGWRLLLYGWNGHTRQLLDIIYLTWENTGSSLYYDAHDRNCAKVFDQTGDFSPGFEKKFLDYFAVSTEPKVEYITVGNAVGWTCPICPLGELWTGNTSSETTGNQRLSTYDSYDIIINSLDYIWDSWDGSLQKITLTASSSSWDSPAVDLSQWFYLQVGSKKKYLSGLLNLNIQTPFVGNFNFLKTQLKIWARMVSLNRNDVIFDTYSYQPIPQPKVKTVKKTTAQSLVFSWTYKVTSIIDGDTFRIKYQGKTQGVRILGIDAPESTILRYGHTQCLGKEAKKYLDWLIKGKEVTLFFDESQDQTDVYWRLLSYVYVDDTFVNQQMIADGYAKEYTFKSVYQFQSEFKEAEQQAQTQKVWLRNITTCGWDLTDTGAFQTGEYSWNELSWFNISSGLVFKITYVLPDPMGSDSAEEMWILVQNSWSDIQKWFEEYLSLSSWFSLEVNGKKKKIQGILTIGQETILSWKLGLLNNVTCLSLKYEEEILDTFCYPKPKSGQKFYASQSDMENITTNDVSILRDMQLKKINNQFCITYSGDQLLCKKIPDGKAATITKNELKLYQNLVKLVKNYLQNDRWSLYSSTDLKNYFTLFTSTKKLLTKWQGQIAIGDKIVPVYDLEDQLQILRQYSLWYRSIILGKEMLTTL